MENKETYHTQAYQTAASALTSFAPLSKVGQQLCGLHTYAHDPKRAVKAVHLCTHLRKDLHQCLIYDKDAADARLIGIEYVIPEDVYLRLDREEQRYWHSHRYEVESGMLMLGTKSMVPNMITDVAEKPAMLELQQTWGKTTHTWQYDIHPDLPLGPPQLMMAYTDDSQVNKGLLNERDIELGVDTAAKRKVRAGYLPDLPKPESGGDQWLSGTATQFVPLERSVSIIQTT